MNLSNLGNFDNLKSLNMSGLINTKNKTITGDRFYVGEGILKCNNYFISLDSICMVELGRRQNSVLSYIMIIICGIIICIFSLLLCVLDTEIGMIGVFMGIILGVCGFLGLNHMRKSNEKIPYSMTIHLNDNSTYTYYSLDKEFILNIMEVIQSCINDRRGGYCILNNEEKIEKVDNSINFSGDLNGDFIAQGGTKEIHGDYTNTINKSNNNVGLTVEDWTNLEKFFVLRRQKFSSSDRNYKICNNLVTYTQRKDAGKIKEYLQKIGKEGIMMLLNAGTNAVAMETIKPILQKILSLKG